MSAAFELTRPELNGKYHVTVYQYGWRLGGKGASGRGPAGRIEEHGLHVWMGFYENAFRLLRECFAELDRDPAVCPIADWEDAFFKDQHIGVSDRNRDGEWVHRTAAFPWADGLPGDPIDVESPFTVAGYLQHTATLLSTLLIGVQTADNTSVRLEPGEVPTAKSADELAESISDLLRISASTTAAVLVELMSKLQVAMRLIPLFPDVLRKPALAILQRFQGELENLVAQNDELRFKWEIIDLVLAIMVGIVSDRLITDPRGFDAIDDKECLDWLQEHGASARAVRSSFVRGLYDLAFAWGADGPDPGLAAGQAIRGSMRMLFTYRGALFWKMRAGMGDVVFAPFYEALKARGVTFRFFHRLENVRLSEADASTDDGQHIRALEFSVQSELNGNDEYEPLIDIHGLPCWPAEPDWSQLSDGEIKKAEGWEFENFWDQRCDQKISLEVTKDFDFVVLGVGIGVVPHVCGEIIESNEEWREMVKHVKTVETQAFQLWMSSRTDQLGWDKPPPTITAYVNPFNTWADMGHLIPVEDWPQPPGALAYFCNNHPDDPSLDPSSPEYPLRRDAQTRRNAIRFLNHHIGALWPDAVDGEGRFRWELLVAADPSSDSAHNDESRFATQFWVASTHPSDRYVLAPPGSLQYRISPLEVTYDNLTICGDWTACGFTEGCVEAAVMSGRLAAHAIAGRPALEDIVGYDHP